MTPGVDTHPSFPLGCYGPGTVLLSHASDTGVDAADVREAAPGIPVAPSDLVSPVWETARGQTPL